MLIDFKILVNKNIEEEKVKWSEVTDHSKEFYDSEIVKNQLLKLFACHEGYNKKLDDLNNWEQCMVSSLRKANEFIKDISFEVKEYFKNCPLES